MNTNAHRHLCLDCGSAETVVCGTCEELAALDGAGRDFSRPGVPEDLDEDLVDRLLDEKRDAMMAKLAEACGGLAADIVNLALARLLQLATPDTIINLAEAALVDHALATLPRRAPAEVLAGGAA